MALIEHVWPWMRQPQGAVRPSSLLAQYGGSLILPPHGPRTIGGVPLTVSGGVLPSQTPCAAGIGWSMSPSASELGYSLPTDTPNGSGTEAMFIIALVADAAPTAANNAGIGCLSFNLSWNHTNATFRGAVAAYVSGWVAAPLGTLEGGRLYVIAAVLRGGALYAIRDGQITGSVAAPGLLNPASSWGVHHRNAGNLTLGANVLAYYVNGARTMPVDTVVELTRGGGAALFSGLLAPRRVRIPVHSAAPSAVPSITFVGAENITSNSASYRVTLDYA